MKRLFLSAFIPAALLAGCAEQAAAPAGAPALQVAFADAAWTGSAVPDGQQCSKFGGSGATPALAVANAPEGTAEIIVAFNDESYQPLSYDGGHGTIGFKAAAGANSLPSVPGETSNMPDGARIVSGNRATGSYATAGYLPPCSGGKGNTYSADVTAVGGDGALLAAGKITLGKY